MRHVRVEARICSLDGSRCKTVEALVDTGAVLSVVPRRVAEELGLKPHRVGRVSTGAGIVEVERAAAIIEVEGRRTVTGVLISDVVDELLIGRATLEMLGLQVDPATGRLRESPLLLY